MKRGRNLLLAALLVVVVFWPTMAKGERNLQVWAFLPELAKGSSLAEPTPTPSPTTTATPTPVCQVRFFYDVPPPFTDIAIPGPAIASIWWESDVFDQGKEVRFLVPKGLLVVVFNAAGSGWGYESTCSDSFLEKELVEGAAKAGFPVVTIEQLVSANLAKVIPM